MRLMCILPKNIQRPSRSGTAKQVRRNFPNECCMRGLATHGLKCRLGAHKKTHELLCQEYVLQSDRVIYRIRPKDEKHPVLLPVGEQAQFRMDKDKMILRVEDLDDKDRQYSVTSMKPRDDAGPDKASLK